MLGVVQRRAVTLGQKGEPETENTWLVQPSKERQNRNMITLHKYIKPVNIRYRKEPFKLRDCSGTITNRLKLANVAWKLGDTF